MQSNQTMPFAVRLLILTAALWLCNLIASALSGLGSPGFGQWSDTLILPLFVYACQSLALSYPIVHSRWTGWRLIATVFLVFFGITTFLSQIESIVFLEYLVDILPADVLPKMVWQGALSAALYAPLAVWIHGKLTPGKEPPQLDLAPGRPWTEWVWKSALLAVLYGAIYFAFGLLVPLLAGDAFQTYYAGLQLPAWIVPFQLVRALIWVGLALPVMQLMQGSPGQRRLAVAILFSVLMGFQLLLPNEFMPEAIRLAHFVEVTASNFLFGWLVVGVLQPQPRAVRRPSPA